MTRFPAEKRETGGRGRGDREGRGKGEGEKGAGGERVLGVRLLSGQH